MIMIENNSRKYSLKEICLENYDIRTAKEIATKFGFSYHSVRVMMSELKLPQPRQRNSIGTLKLYKEWELLAEYRYFGNQAKKDKMNEWVKWTRHLEGKFFIHVMF